MTLKELRLHNKKTIAEVANVLGVSYQAVVNYESGIRSINLYQIIPLSNLFGESAETVINAQINSCQYVQEGNLLKHQRDRRSS